MISLTLPKNGGGWGVVGDTATNSITQTPVSAWADSQFHEWNQAYPARGLGVEERRCVYICRLHLLNTSFFSELVREHP